MLKCWIAVRSSVILLLESLQRGREGVGEGEREGEREGWREGGRVGGSSHCMLLEQV